MVAEPRYFKGLSTEGQDELRRLMAANPALPILLQVPDERADETGTTLFVPKGAWVDEVLVEEPEGPFSAGRSYFEKCEFASDYAAENPDLDHETAYREGEALWDCHAAKCIVVSVEDLPPVAEEEGE